MMLRGIDASHFQSEIDMTLLSRLADFAVFKASQDDWEDVTFNGTGTVDGSRRFLFRDARDSGLVAGAYHYLQHSTSGGAQALTFVRAVKAANGAHMDGALCVLFVEHDLKRKSMPTADDVTAFIRTFQILAPMQPLFIATNAPYWSAHVRLDLQQFDNVYVWLEKWTDASGQIDAVKPMVPEEWWKTTIGGRVPSLIQFSSQTRVGGVRVDGSLYRGDRKSLERLASVSLPFMGGMMRTHALPVSTVPFRPRAASDTDDRKRAGKTTLVMWASLLGVAAIVAAVWYVSWGLGKTAAEPIFDGGF